MSIGDIFYIIAMILFSIMTFAIIRNYYRSKFNDDGQRLDMLDEYEDRDREDKR
ncbi:hypothetical protein MNB_SV-6-1808 [hydrothermal vent metagenome]|uniref:Uncharacterized protein n=1 Tax=hydrothermal vent metagenome TaxID=652676 RepID=A0A1W1BAU0_9ZZZZ